MMSVFTSIGICFMTQIMVCLGKCFMCIWKESVYSAIVGSGVLKVLLRFSWLVMLCKLSIPLLIFYLINYYERNVDIYHYNCGFFSPLSSVFMYFEVLVSGMYIHLLLYPLDELTPLFLWSVLFLLPLMFRILKSSLSSVNIAYPAFCWLAFAWFLFLFFYCHPICTFMFKVGFL